MGQLRVSFAPTTNANTRADVGPRFVEGIYTRTVNAQTSAPDSAPATVQHTARGTLDSQLRGFLDLPDVAPSSNIDLHFLRGNCGVRFSSVDIAGLGEPRWLATNV